MHYRERLSQHSRYDSSLCQGSNYFGVTSRARYSCKAKLGPVIIRRVVFAYALIIRYSEEQEQHVFIKKYVLIKQVCSLTGVYGSLKVLSNGHVRVLRS